MDKEAYGLIFDQIDLQIKDFCEKQETNAHELLRSLASSGVYNFCLGSGVSADINKECSLPEDSLLWNSLVNEVLREVLSGMYTSEKFLTALKEDSLKEREQQPPEDCLEERERQSLEAAVREFLKIDGQEITKATTSSETVEYIRNIISQESVGSMNPDYLAEQLLAAVIHKVLYGNRKSDGADRARRIIQGWKAQNKEKKTLCELAEAIKLSSDTKPEKQTVDVITYNYDDYVETALGVYGCSNFNSLSDVKHAHRSEDINIYHVHGFIPFKNGTPTANGTIIFSETSYAGMEEEIYRWANCTQADRFHHNNSVLIVGFSGDDSNFRRLMKNITEEDRRRMPADAFKYHYIFLSYGGIIDNLCRKEALEKLLVTLQKQINAPREEQFDAGKYCAKLIINIANMIMSTKSDYFEDKLGIRIIWYYNHKEIPKLLAYLNGEIKKRLLKKD